MATSTTARPFRDRAEAGRMLAEQLSGFRGGDAIVLGLARGGVPVAFEVARSLDSPLDVLVVRKLGVPGHEELAFGAIASGGVRVLNTRLIESLELLPEWIEAVDARERRELGRRDRLYRADRPPADVVGKTAIVVDDGVATGSTMLAALHAIRSGEPARLVAAVPVADPDVCAALRATADDAVCLIVPQPLGAVGIWYEDFAQTGDEEIRDLLERARAGRGGDGTSGDERRSGA